MHPKLKIRQSILDLGFKRLLTFQLKQTVTVNACITHKKEKKEEETLKSRHLNLILYLTQIYQVF